MVAMTMQIGIFKKDGSTYSLNQTILEGNDIMGVAVSPDEQELVSCEDTLKVYRHNGAQFVLSQTISLGLVCF